jgi:hypothetical protein
MEITQYKPIGSLRGQNEELILLTFNQPAQANDRVYLPMNSELDASLITGIQSHTNISFFGVFNFDLPATIEINGKTYNVITGAELHAITITIVDKNRRQCLSNFPLYSLFNLFPVYPNGKVRYKKFAFDILSGECYITFNVGTTVASPFVVPITFIYDDKCK